MLRGEELRHHDHRRGDLTAEAETDEEARGEQCLVVRRQCAQQRSHREDQQVHPEQAAPAQSIHQETGQDAAERDGGEGGRVEQADVGATEPPLGLENRAGDADRVLFDGIEEDTEQDHRDDAQVRGGDADLGVGGFDLIAEGG